MKIFTSEGIKKISELCKNANLTVSWQEGDHTHRLTTKQREDLIKRGKAGFEKIKKSYKELDSSVPGGHHQHIETFVFDFLRDEILIALEEEDFSKECYMFWNLLEERGKDNLGEVVSEMTYEIRAYIKDHSLLKIDLNLDVLLTRENETVYAMPEKTSWDAMQLRRAKKDIHKWCYLPYLNHDSIGPDLEEVNASLIGMTNYEDYKKESMIQIPIAKNLQEYLQKYPNGFNEDANNCIKVSYDNKNDADYVALLGFEPTTKLQARAVQGTHFIDETFYGIKEFSIVQSDEAIEPLVSLGEPFEDALKREIKKAGRGMAEACFEHQKYDLKDVDGRNMLHWAFMSEDEDLIQKLYRAIVDSGKTKVLYERDNFGYSVYGLCQERTRIAGASNEIVDYTASLLLADEIADLPLKNETAKEWKTECMLKGEWGGVKYFILEQHELLSDMFIKSEVFALRVDEPDKPKFETILLCEMDNITPLDRLVEVYLDGTYAVIPW